MLRGGRGLVFREGPRTYRMNVWQLALSLTLAFATLITARLAALPVAILGAMLLGIRAILGRGLAGFLRVSFPVALFAGAVALLQWINGTTDFAVPLRTVTVFLLLSSAISLAPWTWMADSLSPRSHLYHAGLFLLFIRHFAAVLQGETRRTLQARAMAAPRLLHAGGTQALAQAVASVFRRTLIRAERFYAAQSLSGIAQ